MEILQRPHTKTSTSDASPMDAIPRPRTLLIGLFIVMALSVMALCVMVGAAAASSYQTLVLALAGAAVIAAFACVRPSLFGVALVAMLFVPYTWSPTIRNGSTPAIVLFALPAGLAGAATLVLRGRLRLCVLDYLVVAIFANALLSEIVTLSGVDILGADALSHDELQRILLPYFAFRLILAAWPQVILRLPYALMMTGAGLSLFGIWEELNRKNFFAHSSLNNPQLALWEANYPRAGGIRVDATMGHPIAFGSFLVIPLVFAFAQRRWGLFALIALGEALTLSRGPYVAAVAVLLLYSILTRRIGRLWVLLAAVGILALFVGPVRNSVTNSFQAGTGEQRNATYRSELLTTSLTSLTLWGKPTGEASELYGSQNQSALTDVTSEFALLSGRQGVLGLTIWIGFLAGFAYTIREARQRRDPLLLILGVALIGEWVALLSVALITSFQCAFLLTVALAAARLSQSAPPTQHPNPADSSVGAQEDPAWGFTSIPELAG
jgi:hypothetical protein